MKIISTKAHGLLDYLVGILLIAAPWLFGFADRDAATIVPLVMGIATLVYSIFTNYELGLLKMISMDTHLVIDALSGIILAASPWIFGFADKIYWPHLAVGLMEIIVVLLSQRQVHYVQHPGNMRRHADA